MVVPAQVQFDDAVEIELAYPGDHGAGDVEEGPGLLPGVEPDLAGRNAESAVPVRVVGQAEGEPAAFAPQVDERQAFLPIECGGFDDCAEGELMQFVDQCEDMELCLHGANIPAPGGALKGGLAAAMRETLAAREVLQR